MKKRNIAVAMAAVTVAGTVAPVVANAAEQDNAQVVRVGDESAVSEVIAKVEKALAVKYDNNTVNGDFAGKSVYTILVGDKEITNVNELKTKLNSLTNGSQLNVTITDKGHYINDKKEVLRGEIPKYTNQDLYDLAGNDHSLLTKKVDVSSQVVTQTKDGETAETITVDFTSKPSICYLTYYPIKITRDKFKLGDQMTMEYKASEGTLTVIENNEAPVEVKVKKSGTTNQVVVPVTLPSGSQMNVTIKDISKSTVKQVGIIDNSGTPLLFGKTGTKFDYSTNEYKVVLKSKLVNSGGKYVSEKTIPGEEVDTITVTLKPGMEQTNFKPIVEKVNKNEYKLIGLETEEMAPVSSKTERILFTNSEVKEVASDKLFNGEDLTPEFKEFLSELTPKDDYEFSPIRENKEDKTFEISLYIKDIKLSRASVPTDGTMFEVVIKSKSRAELEKLTNVVENGADFEVIAGDNRFETAIEVSKKRFPATSSSDEAKAIVLVNKDAVVDGLAAAPLAEDKKAPILFSNLDSINKETMDEIKRSMRLNNGVAGKTVYLVGGEARISKDVETQLKSLGLSVKRISGDTRYETSVKIAKELSVTPEQAFVVGGEGLVDAMSVSGIAASAKSPIIVTPKNGLNDDAKKYLKDTTSIVDVDIIGGDAVVSEQVEKDLKAISTRAVERVEGINRQETNAKVIKKYVTAPNQTEVYVAKQGNPTTNNMELVDALVAAPLVGDKALVLATNELSNEQAKVVGNLNVKVTNGNKNVVIKQVGYGVKTSVIERIKDRLGL